MARSYACAADGSNSHPSPAACPPGRRRQRERSPAPRLRRWRSERGTHRHRGRTRRMYRLISATPSPYARKVRIALAEKGIPFELRTEVPWNATTATPSYNPLEKLPVLVLLDGRGVYELRFILEWLEAKHPDRRSCRRPTDGDPRRPAGGGDRRRHLRRAACCCSGNGTGRKSTRAPPGWRGSGARWMAASARWPRWRRRGTAGATGWSATASASPTSRRAPCSAISTSASPNIPGGACTPPWSAWPTAGGAPLLPGHGAGAAADRRPRGLTGAAAAAGRHPSPAHALVGPVPAASLPGARSLFSSLRRRSRGFSPVPADRTTT